MVKYTSEKQLVIPGFESGFIKNLNAENRWVKLSRLIPWDELAGQYIKAMREDFGRPATNPRIVIGSLIIKHLCGFSDEQTIEHISENVYMQYFLGYEGFNDKPPFDATLFVRIRKRLGLEAFEEMNRRILELSGLIETHKKEGDGDKSDSKTNKEAGSGPITHKGRLLIDATVCPQDIKYPTDLELLSDARKKSEELIDMLYEKKRHGKKPRTDRNKAREEFLKVAKKKIKGKKEVRKALRRQLSYLRKNINSIDGLLDSYEKIPLKQKNYKYLLVIREVYRQQKEKYKSNSTRIPDRIVSIHQPHVRPMVRGKASAKTEFGSKLTLSLINGYSILEKLSWDAYHEGRDLIEIVKGYKKAFGYYPKEVAVDKIFMGRENRKSLKELGIKLIGRPLGRPPKGETFEDRAGIRNPVEGKFGQGKRAYRLGRVFAKLKDTSESWIAASFFVMNLLTLVKQCQHFWPYTKPGLLFITFRLRARMFIRNILIKQPKISGLVVSEL